MRFKFSSEDGRVTPASALRDLFAFSGYKQLRRETGQKYLALQVRKHKAHQFTAELQLYKSSTASTARFTPEDGWVSAGPGGEVETAEASTVFAYDTNAGILLYRETAALPYTRLLSYARLAQDDEKPKNYSIEFQTIAAGLKFREMFEHFDSIQQVRFRYTHSQSPGNQTVDYVFEQLDAAEVSETIKAEKGGSLAKEKLLQLDDRIAPTLVFDHLEKNADNGEAVVEGLVGTERLKLSSSNPIKRFRHQVATDSETIEEAIRAYLEIAVELLDD